MFKKALFITLFIVNTITVYAQQYAIADLLGRWRLYRNGYGIYHSDSIDLIFLSGATGAFVSPKGLLSDNIVYTANIKNDIIKIKYTVEIGRKSPTYRNAEIKFLNDSTFLFRLDGSIPKNNDTTNKKIHVYRKLKFETRGTEPRIPNYKDLVGQWGNFFKGKINDNQVVFLDRSHMIFKYAAKTKESNYTVNFTKQPIPIDFYSDSTETRHAFLRFTADDLLEIEYFPNNNRKDHFTLFGQNILYIRQKPADAANLTPMNQK